MFVRKTDDDQSAATELPASDSATERAPEVDAPTLAGSNGIDDEQTTEQAELESNPTVDANSDGLDDETDTSAETFSRTYVEKLRRESAGYRERAQRADELAARLHTALVAATGRLADPTDLPFDAAHLDDEQSLVKAIDELLTRKPHLATRRPFGDVGQGNRGGSSEPVNLADILRARA